MGVIESEEAARRLARVIVSDIEIYNREKFQAGADLTAAIEEGRALFRSRVAPEFLPLFTSVLEDRRGASRKRAAAAKPATAPATATAPAERAPASSAPAATPRWAADPGRATATPATPPDKPAEPAPLPVADAEAAAVAAAEAATPVPTADPEPAPVPIAAAPTPAPEPVPVAPPPAVVKPAAQPSGARAGAIDTEEAAARLARVIVSDIQLYNAKKIASGADLTREIEEGRHLFKTRVSAELLSVFESTLASKGLGQDKRAASPAPAPAKARPAVAAEPTAFAAAPTPPPSAPTPAPLVASRPSISAVKAPPAAQPRPGVTVSRRPTPAPLSVPMAMAEAGSGRHHAPSHAPTPGAMAEAGSGRHHAPGAHAARLGLTTDPPSEDDVPTPGAMAGMAIGITPPPSDTAHPTAARALSSRPPPTPASVQHPPRPTGPQMRIATPVPPSARRERPPSLPGLPIAVDSGPHHLDPAHAALPPQEVLDALPAPAPLPPLPVTGGFAHPPHPAAQVPEHHSAPVLTAPPRQPTPLSLRQPTPMSLRQPTPMSLRQPTPMSLLPPPPEAIGIAPPPGQEEMVSLRRGMSKTRLLLTIAALSGAGGAIWYFLLR